MRCSMYESNHGIVFEIDGRDAHVISENDLIALIRKFAHKVNFPKC